MERVWKFGKIATYSVMLAAPLIAARIAWINLFESQDLNLDYARVFFDYPLYLIEALIFIELLCLFVVFLDKMRAYQKVCGVLIFLGIVSGAFGDAYYQGLVPGCRQARMRYERMNRAGQDKVSSDFEFELAKLKADMDKACGA